MNQEIKDFILFCKDHKVKKAKLDKIEFEFSDLAFITEQDQKQIEEKINKINDELEDSKEQEELLFWSTKN